MKILLFIINLFIAFSGNAAELGEISANHLQEFQSSNNALIIDIRTQQEWDQTGTIPASSKMEYFDQNGNYNAEQWLKQLQHLKTDKDQTIILVCRSGHRSELVGKFLTQQLGMNNVYHLKGGITSWIKSNHEIEKPCPANLLACK